MTMSASIPTRTPGELVLHPVALSSLAVLVLNDHLLKGVAPGWLTGKLSDVAGLVFLPFLIVATVDAIRRRRPPGILAAAVTASATAVVFAAIKLLDPVRSFAAEVAGVLRAPLDAGSALAAGTALPSVSPAAIVADPSDVVAVVACAAIVLVARRAALAVTDGAHATP